MALAATLVTLGAWSPARATATDAGSPRDPQQHDRPQHDPPEPQQHHDHREPAAEPVAGAPQAGHVPTTEPRTPIPPITDADRAAAFPDVMPHAIHDGGIHSLVLFDQLEWHGGAGAGAVWDTTGWVGGDHARLWFRTEGRGEEGGLGDAELHLLYGRAVARWWDVVVGIRQDFRPGPAQTWAAFGVQGLAPYWFEVEVTGYLSDRGQTALRLEAEYELLITNRLIVQPRVEANLYGSRNLERAIGAGMSTFETGLRLRYEIRRELAPYVGVVWQNAYGETADLAAAARSRRDGPRLVAGIRVWF